MTTRALVRSAVALWLTVFTIAEWELFHRLNREEAARYLEDRARNLVLEAVR